MFITIRLFSVISLTAVVVGLASLYVVFSDGDIQLVLRPAAGQRPAIFGNRTAALTMGVSGWALVMVNVVLARLLQRRHLLAAHLLSVATAVLALLFLGVIAGMLWLN